MKLKHILTSTLLSGLFLLQAGIAAAEPLTVAVAANVKYAFDDLAEVFKKDTGIEVQSVFASAGKITSQVKSGAPYDVFVSADTEFPETLYKEGYAVTQPRVYANGVLVLWSTNPAISLEKGMAGLTAPAIAKVAIANPKVAPYGRAALKAIETAGIAADVTPKLVYGESITQTAQYVESGSADVGFVAKSIVVAPEMQGKGHWVEVAKSSYDPISQGVVVLKHGEETQSANARKFVDFLFSAKARAIFTKFGYLLP
jgi:molybdate transport system substrate-binding protein